MKEKPTANERKILELLGRRSIDWMSPTDIAQTLFPDTKRGSSWASPICKHMAAKEWLIRSPMGWYSIAPKGFTLLWRKEE